MKRSILYVVGVLITILIFGSCDGELTTSSSDSITYIAFGASATLGVGAVPLTNGYVFKIKDELELQFQEVELINHGVLGATIDVIDVQVQDLLATNANPEIITIWTGSNDVIKGDNPEEFESFLETILLQLTEQTSAFIVIANIPDLTQLPRFIKNPSNEVTLERLDAFNSSIQTQASAFSIPVVDLFAEEITDELVSSDGFHPSNKGHERIAELFLGIVLSLIKEP